jgi:hypothetical protein
MCQKSLQLLQNDYKHTGYDNDYKINLAISLIIHWLAEESPHADNATYGKENF